eukprot:12839208-Alexandrium_andersonii.AAC.1
MSASLVGSEMCIRDRILKIRSEGPQGSRRSRRCLACAPSESDLRRCAPTPPATLLHQQPGLAKPFDAGAAASSAGHRAKKL